MAFAINDSCVSCGACAAAVALLALSAWVIPILRSTLLPASDVALVQVSLPCWRSSGGGLIQLTSF